MQMGCAGRILGRISQVAQQPRNQSDGAGKIAYSDAAGIRFTCAYAASDVAEGQPPLGDYDEVEMTVLERSVLSTRRAVDVQLRTRAAEQRELGQVWGFLGSGTGQVPLGFVGTRTEHLALPQSSKNFIM